MEVVSEAPWMMMDSEISGKSAVNVMVPAGRLIVSLVPFPAGQSG